MSRPFEQSPTLLSAAAVLAALACRPAATPEPAGEVQGDPLSMCSAHGDGVFALDLNARTLHWLAGPDAGSANPGTIKYGTWLREDGRLAVVYVPDLTGDLHVASAAMGARPTPLSGGVAMHGTVEARLNGPAVCDRGDVVFGVVRPTTVEVHTVAATDLLALRGVAFEEAQAQGPLAPVQVEDARVAADLNCRDLPSGATFNAVDCTGFPSVSDCLASTTNLAVIHTRASADAAAVPLTSPSQDADVSASPGRPPSGPLGDADPDLLTGAGGTRHLMFERVYTTPAVFDDPGLASEFRIGGFTKVMYAQRPARGEWREYDLDLSEWPAGSAEHISTVVPHMKRAPDSEGAITFAALGVFKTPDLSGMDVDQFTGLFVASFESDPSMAASNRIVVGGSDVEGVVTFGSFACQVWDECGAAPEGELFLWSLNAPKFLDVGDDSYLTFSASKVRVGAVTDGILVFGDGSQQPLAAFREAICGGD